MSLDVWKGQVRPVRWGQNPLDPGTSTYEDGAAGLRHFFGILSPAPNLPEGGMRMATPQEQEPEVVDLLPAV